jgi:hypothetical protein
VEGSEGKTVAQQSSAPEPPPDQLENSQEPGKYNGYTALALSNTEVPPAPITIPGVKMTEPPVIRTIAKGEAVSKIVADVYGVASDAALEFVKKHNPHIPDLNKVAVGTKLILPKSLTIEDGAQ